MATWDIAQEAFTCAGGDHVVGQGEAYRVSTVPSRIGHCEDCSVRLFDEPAPAHVEARDFLHRLRDTIAQQAPARKPGFSRFTKPSVTSVAPGRQPSIDPRGQRQHRHGIAASMRDSFEDDWRRRASGERD